MWFDCLFVCVWCLLFFFALKQRFVLCSRYGVVVLC